MCGRFNFTDDQLDEIKEIIREVNEKHHGKKRPKTGNVYPTDPAAVLVEEGGGVTADVMRWGFPPLHPGERPIINASSESVLEKRMFGAVRTRRCIVPSTGFYEKDFIFQLPAGGVLYMAGFFDVFADGEGGEETRFVILTTAANRDMEKVHDRMPVVLRPDECALWFSQDYRSAFDRREVALNKLPYKEGLVYTGSLFE